MTRPTVLVMTLLLSAGLGSCGKRGNPLPPLRPVPTRITDVTAVRTTRGITLRFTVPSANLDGTTPVVIDRVDVFAWRGAEGATPPAAGVIARDRDNLRTSIPVRRPSSEGQGDSPSTSAASSEPAPGGAASVSDDLARLEVADGGLLAYVLVPVAGSGRGRNGPPSAPVSVPLGPLPSPPIGVALATSESDLRVTWEPIGEGQVFRAVRTTRDGVEVAESDLTPKPLAGTVLSLPADYGREYCVSIRALKVTGAVTLEGDPSTPGCLTPVDRYPPAAPADVRVVQEGRAVVILWSAVPAPDLGGYVVLRGTGTAANLQPLMRVPIRETSYRDETVASGQTYHYAVYAQDSALPPNVSQLSSRQAVTVR